jgi:hypothetical protein
MRRLLVLTAAAGLALAACGSSSSTGDSGTATTSAAGTATTAAAATATTAAATATTKAATATTASAGTTAAAAASGSVAVSMKEWSITPGAIKAGAVSLAVKNEGQNPHELKVIKADSFASLPLSSGAVDESKLAADAIVGKTARIDGGGSATLAVTLPAGKYVFLCNLGSGATSHAAKGQYVDVTVA